VPSKGGGTKLMRTLLEGTGEGVCAGVGEGGADFCGETDAEADSSAVVEGIRLGDSCAAAIWTKATEATQVRILNPRSAIRNLSIVSPVYLWENVVAPFAVAQKFFIDIVSDALIV
jgi:hypothetical protein